MALPKDAKERKEIPVYSGCIKYFPDALAAVAKLSKRGNDQHNPGTPLHWDRSKSGDELDAMLRHIIDEDWDAVAWRALAHLQKHIERQQTKQPETEAGLKTPYQGPIRVQPVKGGEEGVYNVIDRFGRFIGIEKAPNAAVALDQFEQRKGLR